MRRRVARSVEVGSTVFSASAIKSATGFSLTVRTIMPGSMPASAALEPEDTRRLRRAIAFGHHEAYGDAKIFVAICPRFGRVEAGMGVMQFAGHAIYERVKFGVGFYVFELRAIAVADFVPVDAVKFGIVVTIADVAPDVVQNFGAVFG